MGLEDKKVMESLAAYSENPSYRTLRGVGYEPEARGAETCHLKPDYRDKKGVKVKYLCIKLLVNFITRSTEYTRYSRIQSKSYVNILPISFTLL